MRGCVALIWRRANPDLQVREIGGTRVWGGLEWVFYSENLDGKAVRSKMEAHPFSLEQT